MLSDWTLEPLWMVRVVSSGACAPGTCSILHANGRYSFGHWSISGSGANKDDTYVYCAGDGPLVTSTRRTCRCTVCVAACGSHCRHSPMRGCPSVVGVRDSAGRHVIAVVGGHWNEKRETVVLRSDSDEKFSSGGEWEPIGPTEAHLLGVPLHVTRNCNGNRNG